MAKKLDADFWDLIQSLNTDFETRWDCPLTNSEKAARIILTQYKKAIEKSVKDLNDERKVLNISSRFLRDYWPSGVKSNEEKEKESEEQDKELIETDEEGKNNNKKKVKKIPSTTKLNMITIAIGYTGWKEYCAIKRGEIITKNTFFDPRNIKIEELKIGAPPITIGWFPQYFIKLEYLGDYLFKIVSYSYNLIGKYKQGDKKIIYGFGLIYASETCGKTHNTNEGVNGFPLYPQIFLKPSKDFKIEEEKTSIYICG